MRTPISKEEQKVHIRTNRKWVYDCTKVSDLAFCGYLNMKTFQVLLSPQQAIIQRNSVVENIIELNTYGHPIWETVMHMAHYGVSHHIAEDKENFQSLYLHTHITECTLREQQWHMTRQTIMSDILNDKHWTDKEMPIIVQVLRQRSMWK